MLKCDVCDKKYVYSIKSIGNGSFACRDCLSSSGTSGVEVVGKIKLGSLMVSQKQLDELNRRRILPYKKLGGGYYLGRLMENGKISEDRQPNYSS